MKCRLYAKPARAPKWWPRDEKGKARWVGLLSNGIGWVVGQGDVFRTAHEVRTVKTLFGGDQIDDRGRKRKFEFRREKVV